MTNIICPLCKKNSSIVGRTVVDRFIKSYFKKHLHSHEYGFCENANCDIVYHGLENDEIYFKRDFEGPEIK